MAGVSFPWDSLLVHLHRNRVVCRGILGTEVETQGNGPCPEDEFDDFLGECGIAPFPLGSGRDVIVLGWDGWDAKALDATIKLNEGSDLRVYSQEMVIASLAIGADLFEVCEPEELLEFGQNHPGFLYLMQQGFEWPSTEVVVRQRGVVVQLDAGGWANPGVLAQLGYHVGLNGLAPLGRRQALALAFLAPLSSGLVSDVHSEVASWGDPGSRERLAKMANSIASFVRSAKRRTNADVSQAIADWEADLAWLQQEYYPSHGGFRWPDTRVP